MRRKIAIIMFIVFMQSVFPSELITFAMESTAMEDEIIGATNKEEKEYYTEDLENKEAEGIPDNIKELAETAKGYNSLSEIEKQQLLFYYGVERSSMSECCDNGYSVKASIELAKIMQRINVDFNTANKIIEKFGGIEKADKESISYVKAVYDYAFLEEDNLRNKFIALLEEGCEVEKLLTAYAMSCAMEKEFDVSDVKLSKEAEKIITENTTEVLRVEKISEAESYKGSYKQMKFIEDIILTGEGIVVEEKTTEETSTNEDFTDFSASKENITSTENANDNSETEEASEYKEEYSDEVISLSDEYSIKEKVIYQYLLEENITAQELKIKAENKLYELGILQNDEIMPISDSENDEKLSEPPFSYKRGNQYSVGYFSGGLNYNDSLVSLKGAENLDISLSYNYSSEKEHYYSSSQKRKGFFRLNLPIITNKKVYGDAREINGEALKYPGYVFLRDDGPYVLGRTYYDKYNGNIIYYPYEDITFKMDLNNTNENAKYLLKYRNGNIDYFDENGRLIKTTNAYG